MIEPFSNSRRRTNPAGNEFWSSRDFARVLGYVNCRHFQAVIESARTAFFNSGQRVRGVRHKLLIFHCVEHAFEFIKHLMPEPAREPLLSSKP